MRFGNRTACYQLAREDIYVCWLNRSARTENAKEKPCLLYAQRFPYVVTNAYSEFKTTHRTRNVRGIRLLETWHNAAGELSARQNQSMQIYGTLRTVNTRIPFCSSGSEQTANGFLVRRTRRRFEERFTRAQLCSSPRGGQRRLRGEEEMDGYWAQFVRYRARFATRVMRGASGKASASRLAAYGVGTSTEESVENLSDQTIW